MCKLSTNPLKIVKLIDVPHSQLDRVWWQWQQDRSYQRLLEYSANGDEGKQTRYLSDVISLGVLANNVSVQEVMDTEAGFLCYRY
jgi:tyrosinase